MACLRCVLCDCEIPIVEFDLRESPTLYSKTPLLTLLQNCVEGQLSMTSFEICKMCYFLLNELDSIKVRAKAIEDQLKNYANKHTNHVIPAETNTNTVEECTVCFKKVSSRNYKSHLKIDHPELNDLETSFDFDEVNSISDINPSLDDINILSSVDTAEKNTVKIENSNDVKKATRRAKKKDSNSHKAFECMECSKTWKTSAELKSHMLSHNSERPYICEICGQAYKRQQALAIHVGMHNGINPFTCVYCNKSFTQKGALVRHTPIHTGELPFQCDLCGKRFVHHTSFNMHRLSHTGQKSYKCEICGLSLMSGSHLKRHMRVHTGEKKYSCETCGKKFAERYNLAVHEKLHLGVSKKKKYQCQICDNLYNRQVKLEEHLLTVHQKIQNPNEQI